MKRMTKYTGLSWKWRKYMAIEVDQWIKVVVDGWDLSRKGLYGCLRALTESTQAWQSAHAQISDTAVFLFIFR